MTRKILIGAAVLAGLAMGQGCPGPGTSARGPDSPIPEGVYSGQVTYTSVVYINGRVVDTIEQTITSTPEIFGPQGLPLAETNEPAYVGYSETSNLGGMEVTMTITALRAISNGLAANFDVRAVSVIEGRAYEMLGSGQSTYKVNSDGSLAHNLNMSFGMVLDGDVLSQSIVGTGTLFP